MISTFIISLGTSVFSAILAILPSSTSLPTGVHDALVSVGYFLNSFSYLIPVSSFITAVSIVVSYEVTIWLFNFTLWIWNKVPIIGK